MTSKETSKTQLQSTTGPDGYGFTTFPVRLEDKRYELAVLDNMPLALMHQDRDEYYPYNPVREGFVVQGITYKLIALADKRYSLEKVDTSEPLSFRMQFLQQRSV